MYLLGTGDYEPHLARNGATIDVPWTPNEQGKLGSDCAGFAICWCWRIPRHHPGFNHGSWSSVEDDINSNSAIEDGEHEHRLFDTLGPDDVPQQGDLLAYPTVRIAGRSRPFIGHVGIVEQVPVAYRREMGWQPLVVIQCHGPDERKPAVVRTDGLLWDARDRDWPKAAHRTHLVRPKERS